MRRTGLIVTALLASGAGNSADFGPIGGAIGETKPIIDTRLRYEGVDQDPMAEDADAQRLGRLLRGEPDDGECTTLGPVALRYSGDIVGRASCGRQGLTSEIPKARAIADKTLLE